VSSSASSSPPWSPPRCRADRDLAADLTGARYGALGVLGADGTITEVITSGVTDAERAAIGHLPVGRGILGVLIEDATPLRLRDIADDPRSVGFPTNHPPMRSFLGAPVSARGQVFGNLYLTEKQDAEALAGTAFPVEGSVSGEVIRTGKTVAVADAASDQRVRQPALRAGGIGPALFAPLAVRGAVLGTLLVANATGGRPFGEGDVQLTETFAEQAAVAVEHARLQQELDRLAVLEDRERIAKELHDGVIQALLAVGLGLQGSAMLARDPELQRRIGGAVEELDRVIGDLRNYIFGLRPGILADRQLDQALRGLAEELEHKAGVVTVVEVDPQAAAALAEVAAEVVQLAREALSNVSRHAQASTCRVSLYRGGGTVELEVDDDGRGFDPATARPRGQGLGNLRARAQALGGRVEIDSHQGEGTRVRVQLTRPSLPT
jgi:signal transduction histidine kinase